MLKIFLVEDEFVVREGIKNNIDWKSNGYVFCGEASDGELAFPMIQRLKPDIVITDIKMPFMDGLSLSSLIKKEMPETEIIILTGYEEFEYAKEAIKIGVAQYLTKPISGDELLCVVNSIADKIEEKNKEKEIKEKYLKEIEENRNNEKKDFFRYLLTGSKSMPELMIISEKMDINITAIYYNLFLFKVQSLKHQDEEYSNKLIIINNRIMELEDRNNIIIFDRDLEGKGFLFMGDSKEEIISLQNAIIDKIIEILDEYKDIRYFGGLGVIVNRLSELTASYEKAARAFAHRYIINGNHILNGEVMYNDINNIQEEFNICDVNTNKIDRNKITDFLKTGVLEETVYFVEGFFKELSCREMKSEIFRQYITMDVYFCVIKFVESIFMPKEEIETLDIRSDVLSNGDAAVSYIIKIIKQAIELREKAAGNRYGHIVDEVMNYIDKNYGNDELSLNIIASHVNFSPNHLSMIFSQQTGKTLVKYLTDFRMNKAKELLRCTGKKNNIIAQEVGYKDPHYFSYLFKKTQNMTPTQYRGEKHEGTGN